MGAVDLATEMFELVPPGGNGRVVRGRLTLPRPSDTGADTGAERSAAGDARAGGASGGPPPCALLLHGFKGFMDWGFFPLLARELAERGVAAVAFNFSGSGIGPDLESFSEDEAFAKDTFTRQLEDAELVREHVAHDLASARGVVDGSRVGIFGHSRGGGMALVHAAERGDYRAVATWAAIPDIRRFDDAMLDLWRRQGFITVRNARTGRDHRIDVDMLEDAERHSARLDIEAACGRLAAPTLVVHGEADEVVELAALGRLAAALPPGVGLAQGIPGAGHTFGARHPLESVPVELRRAIDLTVGHFTRHLAPEHG